MKNMFNGRPLLRSGQGEHMAKGAGHSMVIICVCTIVFIPTCLSIDVNQLAGTMTRHPEVVINVCTAAIRVAQCLHRFWAEVSQYPFVSYGKNNANAFWDTQIEHWIMKYDGAVYA